MVGPGLLHSTPSGAKGRSIKPGARMAARTSTRKVKMVGDQGVVARLGKKGTAARGKWMFLGGERGRGRSDVQRRMENGDTLKEEEGGKA